VIGFYKTCPHIRKEAKKPRKKKKENYPWTKNSVKRWWNFPQKYYFSEKFGEPFLKKDFEGAENPTFKSEKGCLSGNVAQELNLIVGDLIWGRLMQGLSSRTWGVGAKARTIFKDSHDSKTFKHVSNTIPMTDVLHKMIC
jgi:hypothetical protein